MKKIITISVIFVLLLSAAVWEIVYSSNLYKDVYASLTQIDKSIETHKEKLDNPETIELVDKMINRWKKGREVVFCLGNHTVLRNIDEKLFSLQAMIQTNHKDDSPVTVKVCMSLIEAIKNDTHPVLSNLF